MGDKELQTRGTESSAGDHPVIKFVTAATVGAGLLFLSGLTLTGTVIGLVVMTPLLVIFSPVLVPASFAIFLVVAGFIVSGGLGMAALGTLTWIYMYAAGKHPVGLDQLERARTKLANKAKDVKERAKEYGHYVQSKAQNGTQAQGS